MNRRSLLKLIGIAPLLPAAVRQAIAKTEPEIEVLDESECKHRNVKTITQADMDEDMRRRGDIVCSGFMVFYLPGRYCADCYARIGD